nr:MAG TPA: hypothetical protein [Bacteriophage sp.]
MYSVGLYFFVQLAKFVVSPLRCPLSMSAPPK